MELTLDEMIKKVESKMHYFVFSKKDKQAILAYLMDYTENPKGFSRLIEEVLDKYQTKKELR